MRSTRDRIRHAISFELIGLALITPLGAFAFGMPAADIGVVGIGSATIATGWNYLYNLGFDHLMQRFTGGTQEKHRNTRGACGAVRTWTADRGFCR
jgi:uncharacterized membrane protein